MSTGISFSGLATGVDTNSIVERLMQLERQPIRNVERDKATVQSRRSVVQEINNLLKTLRDKARVLLDASTFKLATATSTDGAVATATADSTAAAGSYNVVVTALSKAHTLASAAAPPLSDDVLHVTVGSTTVDVAVSGSGTLQDVADAINGASGTPVSASVVNNKLVLISRTTGAAGAITVTSDGGLAGALGFTTTQAAQDAAATVNGLAVTSSGNTISGAIAGVTLTLAKEGATVVNVGLDGKTIEAKVKEFVDAYNAVVDNVRAATKYDAATKTKGTLQGDQTLTAFLGQLRGLAGSAVGSLSGQAYDSLARIGITTSSDRSGKLVLDSAAFRAALAADADAVRDVFAADDGDATADGDDGVAVRIADLADSFATDVLAARLQGFTDQLSRMDKKIADLEVVLDLREKRLRAQFAAMEKAVATFRAQGAELLARLGLPSA